MAETVSIDKQDMLCEWCGQKHPGQACPLVKEIEYYPDGQIKRVIFWEQAEGDRSRPLQPKTFEG